MFQMAQIYFETHTEYIKMFSPPSQIFWMAESSLPPSAYRYFSQFKNIC